MKTYNPINSITAGSRYKKIRQAVTGALLFSSCVSINAENSLGAEIYTAAPSPYELADKLFEVRYRAIVINEDPLQQQNSSNEKIFAMKINFKFDSTQILPRSYPLLDAVGEMMNLKSVAGKRIVIEGHTDAIGNENYNQVLSERRANAIRQYLNDRHNVTADRMVIQGKGESDLLDTIDPGNKINRRVQFKPYS